MDICRQVEEHLYSLHSLVNHVKDIGSASLCSNPRIPSTNYNHAFRIRASEPEADRLIADVVKYYESMRFSPCFVVSPTTRPPTFANSLVKAGFEPTLEEDIMVYRGKDKNFRVCAELNIAVNDGSLIGVWTDVSMKSFGVPIVFRDALLDMYGKATKFKGTMSYLGLFQGKPAGSCGLVSFDNVGGIFSVGTAPEFRKKGIATALLLKAVADSLTLGNTMLYLITTKGSDAERLYMSLGFEVAYSHYRYEFHPSTK